MDSFTTCFQCGLPINHCNKMVCNKCAEKIQRGYINELQSKLNKLGEELGEVSAKVDSGRCKGSDVQRMRRLCNDWLATEQRLIEAKKAL